MEEEWGQLRAGPPSPHPDLKRGEWHPVTERMTSGLIRLSVRGQYVPTHERYLRIVEGKPTSATRVRPLTMPVKEEGQPTAMMRFYAVCPENHELGEVGLADERVRCPECGCDYQLDDEPVFHD